MPVAIIPNLAEDPDFQYPAPSPLEKFGQSSVGGIMFWMDN